MMHVRSSESLSPSTPSRARLLVALASASLTFGLVLAIGGCSATVNPPATTAECDSSKCAAGNTCIKIGEETKCRKTCESNTEPGKSCPFGYTCSAVTAQDTACTGSQCYCAETSFAGVKDPAKKITKKDKGQWTASCNPTGGIAENPDCDFAQGFQCYAKNPSDGNAYCTRACATDNDCGPGLFCSDANDSPNAEFPRRNGDGTIKVCLKRDYCAPCGSTIDCPTGQTCLNAGTPGAFCSAACTRDTECAADAYCAEVGTKKMCFPNAGTCVGDGTFCSPCRSDLDCKKGGGICSTQSAYTTERFCTAPSPSKCATAGDCPAKPEGVAAAGCAKEASDDIPAGSCVGLFKLGTNNLPGCWSRPRK